MLLQTDPTVIYGMGESSEQTEKLRALICVAPHLTILMSLRACRPPRSLWLGVKRFMRRCTLNLGKSLYFVARGDGGNVLSNSLAEHDKAVREYQLKRRADYRSSPAPAASQ